MLDMNGTELSIQARLNDREREVAAILRHRSQRAPDRAAWPTRLLGTLKQCPSRHPTETETTSGRGLTVARR